MLAAHSDQDARLRSGYEAQAMLDKNLVRPMIAPSLFDQLREPGSNPAGWVRTVALNLVRSQWRREQTRSAAAVPVVASYEDPPCTDPELVAALARLSNRQREAVVLHHLLDLDVAGCAAAMGIAASSVKAHLQRGRAALEAALGDRVLTTEGVA